MTAAPETRIYTSVCRQDRRQHRRGLAATWDNRDAAHHVRASAVLSDDLKLARDAFLAKSADAAVRAAGAAGDALPTTSAMAKDLHDQCVCGRLAHEIAKTGETRQGSLLLQEPVSL